MAKRVVILTGGIGSGKSAAARMFADLGVTVVDADEISHRITGPRGAALPAIAAAFGPKALTDPSPEDGSSRADDGGTPGGAMNRAYMRDLVFQDPAARRQLESILHPMIRDIAQNSLAAAPGRYAIYMVPLWQESLAGSGFAADHVIVVDCTPAQQLARVMQRNQLNEDQVKSIMAAQASREERLKAADLVIDNSESLDALQTQVNSLHQRLNQP